MRKYWIPPDKSGGMTFLFVGGVNHESVAKRTTRDGKVVKRRAIHLRFTSVFATLPSPLHYAETRRRDK